MNSKKRMRSSNWDEDEKQLLRTILKEYATIIENKSLDCNSNKKKIKAWEETHKKFNELNGRPRKLDQLKIQWKGMKLNARKTISTFNKEANKTGGGARPKTPDDSVIEVKDLINPAELLIDMNLFDSDGIVPSTSTDHNTHTEQDSKPLTIPTADLEHQDGADIVIETIGVIDGPENLQTFSATVMSQEDSFLYTPKNKTIKKSVVCGCTNPISEKVTSQKRKNNIAESSFKSRQDRAGDYLEKMVSHSEILKEKEHTRKMEMAVEEHAIKMEIHRAAILEAKEEHAIKMEIHRETLKTAILEREIVEMKKKSFIVNSSNGAAVLSLLEHL